VRHEVEPGSFQAELSTAEFYEWYGMEAKCRAEVEAARWPEGFVSPACSGAARTRFERSGLRYRRCGTCTRQRSMIGGTIFEASKLPSTRWFQAMQLHTQSKNNVSALELMRQLGASDRSAWPVKHKIMEAMHLGEDRCELDRRVEMDDACLGGERSAHKTGRGSENKLPIVAAVQTTPSGRPVVTCLRQQSHIEEEVAVFAATNLPTSAPIVSSRLWYFRATAFVGAGRERIVTSAGKVGVELPQFRAVNTLLGNLETAITATYHAFSFAR
jgi:hypothetical protein